jgi:hypothetical protein
MAFHQGTGRKALKCSFSPLMVRNLVLTAIGREKVVHVNMTTSKLLTRQDGATQAMSLRLDDIVYNNTSRHVPCTRFRHCLDILFRKQLMYWDVSASVGRFRHFAAQNSCYPPVPDIDLIAITSYRPCWRWQDGAMAISTTCGYAVRRRDGGDRL